MLHVCFYIQSIEFRLPSICTRWTRVVFLGLYISSWIIIVQLWHQILLRLNSILYQYHLHISNDNMLCPIQRNFYRFGSLFCLALLHHLYIIQKSKTKQKKYKKKEKNRDGKLVLMFHFTDNSISWNAVPFLILISPFEFINTNETYLALTNTDTNNQNTMQIVVHNCYNKDFLLLLLQYQLFHNTMQNS